MPVIIGDQMATQAIKRSPNFCHDTKRESGKTVAIQYFSQLHITAQHGNIAIGKDEVASSNLASSSNKKPGIPTSFGLSSFLRHMVPTPKTDTKTDTAYFLIKIVFESEEHNISPCVLSKASQAAGGSFLSFHRDEKGNGARRHRCPPASLRETVPAAGYNSQ